jgi:hypothetical protein
MQARKKPSLKPLRPIKWMWERHPWTGIAPTFFAAALEGELEREPRSQLNDPIRSSTRDVTVN